MQLTTTHENISGCLDYIISVVPSTRVDPILSHVLIKAKKNKITMVGTNHEVQMTASCPGEAKDAVERIIPADKLRRVLATFGGDTVIKMEFGGSEVKIFADRSTFKLMTQETDNFTLLGETSKLETLETLSCGDFLDAISKVSFATAEESHRRSLNGVLLQRGEEGIDFVGTDGHRMAVKTVAKTGGKGDNYILPIKSVQTLIKHVGDKGDIEISANDRVVRFKTDRFEFISNIISETYPDYQQVIPRSNSLKALVEREKLKKSLDRVMALSDNNAVAYLAFEKNKLGISCNNSDNDSLEETLDIKYKSEKITLALNAVYLSQFLNVCKEQMVEIQMSAPENSVLLLPQEEEGQTLSYVIMPVRT